MYQLASKIVGVQMSLNVFITSRVSHFHTVTGRLFQTDTAAHPQLASTLTRSSEEDCSSNAGHYAEVIDAR